MILCLVWIWKKMVFLCSIKSKFSIKVNIFFLTNFALFFNGSPWIDSLILEFFFIFYYFRVLTNNLLFLILGSNNLVYGKAIKFMAQAKRRKIAMKINKKLTFYLKNNFLKFNYQIYKTNLNNLIIILLVYMNVRKN